MFDYQESQVYHPVVNCCQYDATYGWETRPFHKPMIQGLTGTAAFDNMSSDDVSSGDVLEHHMNPQSDLEIPLTEATFCILLSLAPGPRHGYAILQDVRSLSDGRVNLSTGTLYGAIKRLLEAGWIMRHDDESQAMPSARAQKLYRLTETGRRIFDAERARMRALIEAAQRRAGEARV